ncbi:MAG: iron-regulated protein [Sandaracinaceae bacterium]|nr:iron-regulated protein [Sandaracinaceae bacterium]
MRTALKLSIAASMLLGCGEDLADVAPTLETYGALAEAEYEDSLTAADALAAAIDAFTADPTEASLRDARDAWIAARDPYLQTEAYRYYGGPIEQGDPEHEGELNNWPIDESVIDYVRDGEGERLDTGIVNDDTVIDGATLRAENTAAGETAVTTGYHPIEFLLWGQDDPALEGAGMRPASDYVDAPNAARRATYLGVAAGLVQEELAAVLAEWRDEPGTYRRAMVEGAPRDGLRDVLTGLAEMSGPELAGERIGVALITGDQEDEHSCFSDNTHREIAMDALGVQNVYLGRYVRLDGSTVSGPSLSDLVRSRDADLDDRMRAQLEETARLAGALPGPFDEMILQREGREQLDAVVASLRAQVRIIVEIAALFEITLNVE